MERKERDYENNVYKSITFPMKVWVEFENIAHSNYNDCYWLAIKDMMAKSKVIDSVDLIKQDISRLYEIIDDLQSQIMESKEDKKKIEEEPSMTLGGNPIKKGD